MSPQLSRAFHRSFFAAALLGAGVLLSPQARASVVADGITYTLQKQSIAAAGTEQFTLQITGINGSLDTEGGRSGVAAIAFGLPSGFVSATAPSGFSYQSGGLNATGCDGSGNFLCFAANTTLTVSPALPSNSSLSFTFTETALGSDFTSGSYLPDFKIDWVGSKHHYDLVSEPLAPVANDPPQQVPEPSSVLCLGAALLGLGLIGRPRAGMARLGSR